MTERATVLLRHERGAASHYDWMIEDPAADPGVGLLRTWRIAEPTMRWAQLGRVDLEAAADHRRAYLIYEGELTGGRGSVRRVDEGVVAVRGWSAEGAELDIAMRDFRGGVRLRHVEGERWEMIVVPQE